MVFTFHLFISQYRAKIKQTHVLSPTAWKIPGTLGNLISFLPRNPPEPCLLSVPEPSKTLSTICTATLRNLISHLHRNPPEPHQQSAPEPPEPSGKPSAPEPSRTSSALCTGTLRLITYLRRTLRNLISHLHRNPPEPHQPSAPEPFGTSSAICTGRLRNPPEPSPEPGIAAAPDRTRAILG